jgi:hypothetical protein
VRSPLDCIEGTFESAVFTTYSLNLRFVEHWLIPRLHAVGARRIVMFVDESQLGAALEQFGGRSAGRSYHLVSTRLGPGAFHPKLILLHGKEGTRLCVSSANLTVDGQMRNVETAIALDTREPGHRTAIADAVDFLRKLGENAPAHTLDALLGALPQAPEEALSEEGPRFVHNLEQPLIESFPQAGSLVAVAPFSDGGRAAAALAAHARLQVITDGDAFAAPASFFTGGWTITPRSFARRRLHGKAYWTREWLLVGSPNLSEPALLQTARRGNTEAGIVLEGNVGVFGQPPGEPWVAARELADVAPERHRQERLVAIEQARVGSFDAWEDEDRIATLGLVDGPLEYWDADLQRWLRLGDLQDAAIVRPPHLRPQLLRRIEPNGRIRQAVVHRPALLRHQAARGGTTSPGAEAIRKPPLTISGVQALEGALHELYALGGLHEDSDPPTGAHRSEEQTAASLTEWRPARDGDEPRIPPLIHRTWRGDPDTLLALIRKALRLDEPAFTDELDIDLSESEEESEPPERPEPASVPIPPSVEARVLKRYRGSLVKLLERGISYVCKIESVVLADLAFQAVLRLHEELETTIVTVDDEQQPLVEPADLLSQKLRLLDAYLRERNGRDANCLATARVHLGACLRDREHWSPLDWETLEALAHRRGGDILVAHQFAQRAADDARVDLGQMTLLIDPYAERAEWGGFIVEAERLLDDVDCGEDPFPWVAGSDWINQTANSPAWTLAGYAAIAGYRDQQRYGILIRTRHPKTSFTVHALVVDPRSRTTFEAVHWTHGVWNLREYRHSAERHLVRAGRIGSESIVDDVDRGPYQELRDSRHPVAQLIAVAAPEIAGFLVAG